MSCGAVTDPKIGVPLDHAVTLIGYGMDSKTGKEFWLIRNQWDTTWGEEGYGRLWINGDGYGICGIQVDATWPLVRLENGAEVKYSPYFYTDKFPG